MNDQANDIVITGAGLVTGLGLTREQTWRGVLEGRCAVGPMPALETPLPPGKDGGQAVDLPDDFRPDLPRESRYLHWAIQAALREAGIDAEALPCDAARGAFIIGTTLHGMRAAGRFLRTGDFATLKDFLAGQVLAQAAEGTSFTGMMATVCSACSSSLGSVAMGVTLLQSGQADVVIAGGYDTVSEYVYGGFNSLRLVADGPLRPFAKNRRGMKVSEGYGIVVLERATDATARGATPLATILGWGESSDAHHLTQPHPQGDGAVRAIEAALQRAATTVAEIDLITAHATGTPDNDAGEYAAFSRVFGARLPEVPVVAFKSHLGHTLGAAGAVELILSAMALRDQVVPACANSISTDIEFPNLAVSTGAARPARIRATLNTSLGFGGANTCVVLGLPGGRLSQTTGAVQQSVGCAAVHESPAPVGRSTPPSDGIISAYRREREPREQHARDVCVTGIGVVFPGVVGHEALVQRFAARGPDSPARFARPVPESALEGLLSARRVRRMSDYVKLSLAAATLACRHAGVSESPAFFESCAAVLGTMHGSASYCSTYYGQIVREGLAAANPLLFAEGVPNAAAAQLSLMLGLKEGCQTVIGTRTAGLDAIGLAASRIASGAWDRAIVGAAEEHCDLVVQAYRHCGLELEANMVDAPADTPSPDHRFVSGAGAVTFILESRRAVEARQGKVIARISATAARRASVDTAAPAVIDLLAALGGSTSVITSGSGTRVDRLEQAEIRRQGAVRHFATTYGAIAETFSASPLVGLAAAMLGSAFALDAGVPQPVDVAAICTDFAGSVSGVRIERA